MTKELSVMPVHGEDLMMLNDSNHFDDRKSSDHDPMIPVWVDVIEVEAGIGTFG